MEVVKSINEMKQKMRLIKATGKKIGLVPTMGYLHEGHRSLIDRAREENEVVVVSIFVNPTQFGPNEDFDKYPRDEERDLELCSAAGCDIVFLPDKDSMYSDNYSTYVEVPSLTETLCGASRPGHFKGVATVVTKLLNIAKADRAYFGQKDAQQLAVIKRIVKDLDMDVDIVGCPIVREGDGLAKSSRNTYLNAVERQQAIVLYKALKQAKKLVNNGVVDAQAIKKEIRTIIDTALDSDIDYIEIVNNDTMKPIDVIAGEVLIALAVRIGKTRLIDNMMVVLQ
jgi:pantoate--beta-alanine ligase